MKVVFTPVSNIPPCVGKNLNSVTQKDESRRALLRRVLVGDEDRVQMTEIHHLTL